jgi:chromate transporter
MSEDRAATEVVPCSMRDLLAYFARLGTFGFGGPIALAGYMQRDLVERRRWIAKQDYLEGLALAQLSPGPLAAQLAMYLGWVRGGGAGAAAVGVAFIAPSFIMVLALAWLYVRFEGLAWIQGAFYGIGAAVIAIIARSSVKLAKLALGKDWLLWILFAGSAAVTAATESEVVWIFLGCGVVAMVARGAWPARGTSGGALAILPGWLVTGLHGAAPGRELADILWFFTKAGSFVFGSGLAIVPFLYKGVVHEHQWLDEQQFRDAVAVAMVTPGPVVITAGFIGFLAGGPVGSALAAIGTFLPPYLVVVLAARPLRNPRPWLKLFVGGATASATGAIAGAAFVLGRRAVVDVATACIAVGSFAGMTRLKKLPEPIWIALAGVTGVVIHNFVGTSQ